MWAARCHRLIAVLMALPFLLWTATGLLFHVKPGWDSAYEQLSAVQPGRAVAPNALRPLSALTRAPVLSAELLPTALGPLYRVKFATGGGQREALFDARGGQRISPLDDERARTLIDDAVGRSAHPAHYAAVERVQTGIGQLTVHYAGGATVAIGRTGARLRRAGADRERIDALYAVHYMKWTGHPGVDRVLVLFSIVGTWLTTALGLWLLWRGRTGGRAGPH